jgi:hypothetical protein
VTPETWIPCEYRGCFSQRFRLSDFLTYQVEAHSWWPLMLTLGYFLPLYQGVLYPKPLTNVEHLAPKISSQFTSFNFQLPYPSMSERSLREAINHITYGWRQKDGVYSISKFLFPTS